jgi:glycosyltransferase involved in cell wall biosynthesis
VTPCHFLVPGSIDRPTGGSRYDRQIVTGLRDAGASVQVDELPGDFPDTDRTAREAVDGALGRIPDHRVVIIDGLVMGRLAHTVARHAKRLRVLALVHHPLADETGAGAEEQRQRLIDEAQALRTVSGVIATSAFTAQRLRERGLYSGRVAVIPPGCTPRPLATGRPGHAPLILCVASMTPRKAQHRLIEALAGLVDRSWHCQLVGSMDLAPAYAAAVARQRDAGGLHDRVTLTGAADETQLDEAYRRAGLFVLPSLYEGYGMVISEAIAYGLPVITTTGGALATTLPPAAGIAVAPDDPAALREAIAAVLDDESRRQALARGARQARGHLGDWDESAACFMAVIKEASSCPSNSPPAG